MTQLTKQQYDSLVKGIFDTLVANPDVGLGEVAQCRETAEWIVNEWAEANGIETPEF